MGHGMPKSHFESTTQGHVEKQTINRQWVCLKMRNTSHISSPNNNHLMLNFMGITAIYL
jgi:hypothetical protein